MTNKCLDCVYFNYIGLNIQDNFKENFGECRRNSPILAHTPGSFSLSSIQRSWPSVSVEDWCGKFKQEAKQ